MIFGAASSNSRAPSRIAYTVCFEILKIKASSPLSVFKYSPSLCAIIIRRKNTWKIYKVVKWKFTVAFIRFVIPNWYPIGISIDNFFNNK